jgi:hypothetical protein
MSFPEFRFGTCQECGADGVPQTVGLTGADAAARTTSGADGYDPGNGTELKKYRGRLLCPLCVEKVKSDEQSLRDSKKHAEEEKFRGKAGFVNSV